MRILKRLRKSISTILLFIRAFELAYLVLNHKKSGTPHPKKKESDNSIMGISKTKIGESMEPLKRRIKEAEEIDYESEAIPLETKEISFETLEIIDNVISGKEVLTEDSKQAIKSLDGTELGYQIKGRISSLLDNLELSKESINDNTKMADLSALLD